MNLNAKFPPKLPFLLILVVCVAGLANSQKPEDAAAAHLREGQRLSRQGDLTRAIASYDEAIRLKPSWAEAYLQRGYARRIKGALEEAIDDYDKATALDPRTTRNNRAVAQAYTNRGQIRRNRMEIEEALMDFDQAINLLAAEPQPYFDRGQARLLIEDFAGAIADFDTYLKKEKYFPFGRALAFADRGLANHFLGREQEAHKDVEEMLKLVKDDGPIMLQHLEELEMQLMILRHIRAQKKKPIA